MEADFYNSLSASQSLKAILKKQISEKKIWFISLLLSIFQYFLSSFSKNGKV